MEEIIREVLWSYAWDLLCD